MPQPVVAARTKTVETTTKEEIPVVERENQGLGMLWQDYLATISEDELAITEVKVYRVEPRTQEGYICRVLGERVDEAWMQERFGGGVFNVRIWSKSGKSSLERNVKIVGAPKFLPTEPVPPGVTTAVPATSADNAALLALLEKTIDRLDRLQAGTAQPSPAQDQVVQIMADAAKKAVEIAGSANAKPQESNLDSDLQRLKLMAEIFKPTPPPQDKVRDAFQEAMIKKLLDPPPSQGKSLIEELKGLAELRELMGWSEGGGKGEHWSTALIHQAPAVLDRLAEIDSTRLQTAQTEMRRAEIIANARRGIVTPPPTQQPAPVQTSANRPPAARPAAPQPAPAPAAGPLRMTPMGGGEASAAPTAEVVNNAPPSMAGLDTENPAVVQFVKERVVAMVQEGTPGGGIVAFLIGMRQERFVQMLVKYTPEQIAVFLRADPILRQAVDHPDWADVLEEARSYVRDQEAAAATPPLVQ
jgi:hypothetical protein